MWKNLPWPHTKSLFEIEGGMTIPEDMNKSEFYATGRLLKTSFPSHVESRSYHINYAMVAYIQ